MPTIKTGTVIKCSGCSRRAKFLWEQTDDLCADCWKEYSISRVSRGLKARLIYLEKDEKDDLAIWAENKKLNPK
jgi:DNA-directed RNA polymerase subunit RPC12/RpoP